MRVVLTGGGTGGHIYPALAVGDALARRGAAVLFIGNERGLEAELAPRHGVPFEGIPARTLGKGGVAGVASGGWTVARSAARAAALLRWHKASAVVSTGGYASASVVLAGAAVRIPVVLHEPNAVAGRANRWLSRFADRVTLGFAESGRRLPPAKCVVTGVAVRAPERIPERAEARAAMGLDAARPTLLVVGGSQGARAINETVWDSLDGIGALGFQVLHQTGPAHFAGRAREEAERRPWYRPTPYIEDMAAAYMAADAALCRAGASTLAEIAVYGVPAVFVPFPYAADNHQHGNASIYADAGAAFLLEQAGLSPAALLNHLETLAQPERRSDMQRHLATFARPCAADNIARIVLELAARAQPQF